MDRAGLTATYNQRSTEFEAMHSRQKKVLLLISILRLLVIIAAVYFMVLAVKSGLNILFALSGLMVVLFFALVSFHKNQNDRKKLLQELIRINKVGILHQLPPDNHHRVHTQNIHNSLSVKLTGIILSTCRIGIS